MSSCSDLEELLWSFVKFYQTPVRHLGEDLRQFGDMLISDLIKAGIITTKPIGKYFIS